MLLAPLAAPLTGLVPSAMAAGSKMVLSIHQTTSQRAGYRKIGDREERKRLRAETAGRRNEPWIDAFQNAAMILSGMGPVDILSTDWAKLFAGVYAIYSGLTLIGTAGVLIAPIIHRLLHRFRLEDEQDEEKADKDG